VAAAPAQRLHEIDHGGGGLGEVRNWHNASFRAETEFARYRAYRTLVKPAPIELDL
jgi:hypothetical protein